MKGFRRGSVGGPEGLEEDLLEGPAGALQGTDTDPEGADLGPHRRKRLR
jgi:hypothetical protein